MLRRVFRCLERPPTEGLSAQDVWREPPGHSTHFCYQPFGGQWGTWRHIFTKQDGPKEWAFVPFVDEQTMIGGKGRMIYKQHHQPESAVTGSVWLCPNGSFKRVLSRGGAWENVNLGSTHPDEKDHDDDVRSDEGETNEQIESERPETEQQLEGGEVSGGAGESAQGDGDDGQVPDTDEFRSEDPGVALEANEHPEGQEPVSESLNPESLETVEMPKDGEGVDGNGSPVV